MTYGELIEQLQALSTIAKSDDILNRDVTIYVDSEVYKIDDIVFPEDLGIDDVLDNDDQLVLLPVVPE